MATRFYFPAEGSAAAAVSPAFDAGWEQTGQANRLQLLEKTRLSTLSTIATSATKTVPITTTQDILAEQYVSEPIPTQNIIGTVSLVVTGIESAATANVTLAVVVKVVSQDGGTARGTLFSVFGTDAELANATTLTRIVNAQAVTALTTLPGDRLVVEVGGHAAAPTAATTYSFNFGDNAATDFALTSGLITNINPWIEFSQNIWDTPWVNEQFMKVPDGMSTSEKIR